MRNRAKLTARYRNLCMSSAEFPAEDFRATASAFSELSGVLGGFCFTILVLVLSPDFLRNNSGVKDWALGLLLMAAFSHVVSASLLANSMNAPLLKSLRLRKRSFDIGVLWQNIAHILLARTLTLLVYQFSATLGTLAAVVIVLVVVATAALNIGLDYRLLRTKE